MKNDGGPAFPHSLVDFQPMTGEQVVREQFVGMTLRDYFAAKFAAHICAGEAARMVASRDKNYDETNWEQIVASNAYNFADAMLAERSK